MHDPSQPPLISETLLKNRRSLDELAYRRSVTVTLQRNQRKRNLKGEAMKLKRPEQFVREYRIKEGSARKMKRRVKIMEKRTSSTVNKLITHNTVGLVVRIHAGRHAASEIKQQLRSLHLTAKYNAVFVRLDEEMMRRLKGLDAYVAYGFVTKRSVEELVQRRAFSHYKGKKEPLSDNITVEKILGKHGILCCADLANEIYEVGPNFDEAIKILSPFVLSSPVGHFEESILQEHHAVEAKGGFIDTAMEEFLSKIL